MGVVTIAASVRIFEMSGPGTGVDKTSDTVRFKAADDQLANSSNRLPVPSAGGTTISYAKELQFYFHTAPATDITNMRIYSDGTNVGTGNWNIYAGTTEAGSWVGLGSTYGTKITQTSKDFFGFVQSNSLDMRGTHVDGTFTNTGFKGGLIQMQMEVGNDAASGTTSVEVLTASYDES